MVKVLIVFGTRPDAIKMAPLVNTLKSKMDIKVCVSAQHREMLDQVLNIFNIIPDYDLNIMKPSQDLFYITSSILEGIKKILKKESPDIVLVHGDTTTAMATSLAALYMHIPIGHIEAGLRTYNIDSPFPEEFNRQMISKIAKLHFAPTNLAKSNLINEGVDESDIFVTGNTVIDALFMVLEKAKLSYFPDNVLNEIPFINDQLKNPYRMILVTGHRRENFGQGFLEICNALVDIAIKNPDVSIVYPVHLNPNVKDPVNKILSNITNIHLIQPLGYLNFIKLMDLSYLILTDSGGIQEEAPSLGKPVLVMRQTTERHEALNAGTVKLVGADRKNISHEVNNLLNNNEDYNQMSKAHNPYGNGNSCQIIYDVLMKLKL
jgi:UDP-N-acetylglucosamine 2-epimerase (non-hydrolysing)